MDQPTTTTSQPRTKRRRSAAEKRTLALMLEEARDELRATRRAVQRRISETSKVQRESEWLRGERELAEVHP